MKPVRRIVGTMAPLLESDIDTDQIMPKQFLKRTGRTGYGEVVFHDRRSDPEFIFNDERYSDAVVLLTGSNFGTGSSREHAPWGLQQYGFQAIISPSFADIFKSNCAKIGLLTVEVTLEIVEYLADQALKDPATIIEIDLNKQTLETARHASNFRIDSETKRKLLLGLDDIEVTLRFLDQINNYERTRPNWMPTTISGE